MKAHPRITSTQSSVIFDLRSGTDVVHTIAVGVLKTFVISPTWLLFLAF